MLPDHLLVEPVTRTLQKQWKKSVCKPAVLLRLDDDGTGWAISFDLARTWTHAANAATTKKGSKRICEMPATAKSCPSTPTLGLQRLTPTTTKLCSVGFISRTSQKGLVRYAVRKFPERRF